MKVLTYFDSRILFVAVALLLFSFGLIDSETAALAGFAGTLKTSRLMPGWDGVVAGQTATLRCPVGLTYHQLWTVFTGVTLAQMDEIRVVANGQTIMRFGSGTLLDSYNQYEGRLAAVGAENILVIDFDRFGLRTRAGEELTSLGTGAPNDPTPITTLSIEIDINAGAGATTFASTAVQSVPRPLRLIKKFRTFTFNPAGAVDFEISTLPKGDLINKVFFDFSANDLTRLRVERDTFIVFDRTDGLNERIQADGVRVPQASQYVYDPTEHGNGSESLVTAGVNDLRLIATMSGAATLTTAVEYIGAIDA